MTGIIPKDYMFLFNDIKQRIRSAQYEALKAVNKELITLYWDIGQMIVERQKIAGSEICLVGGSRPFIRCADWRIKNEDRAKGLQPSPSGILGVQRGRRIKLQSTSL